jgi:cobalt-zinc-cadmium efflux system membrane fusion protein
MYATARLHVTEERALAIPRSALVRVGDQTVVFVDVGVRPDGLLRFKSRAVSVEDQDGALLPVSAGLTGDERIVTRGAVMLLGMALQ